MASCKYQNPVGHSDAKSASQAISFFIFPTNNSILKVMYICNLALCDSRVIGIIKANINRPSGVCRIKSDRANLGYNYVNNETGSGFKTRISFALLLVGLGQVRKGKQKKNWRSNQERKM